MYRFILPLIILQAAHDSRASLLTVLCIVYGLYTIAWLSSGKTIV